MSKLLRLAVAVALVTAADACDAITGPRTVAQQLPGTWARPFLYPGISTVITLAVADSTITGTGTYTIEAGPSGTIVVTGMVTAGTNIALDLARSDGWLLHFRGTLATPDSLSGFTYGSSTTHVIADPAPDSFHRVVH